MAAPPASLESFFGRFLAEISFHSIANAMAPTTAATISSMVR